MDIDKTVHNLSQKIAEIETAYTKLNELLVTMDADLNRSLQEEGALNVKLKELIGKKSVGGGNGSHAKTPGDAVGSNGHDEHVDATAQLEKLLQGSLDVLGDKISERLMGMLKELKSLPLEMRASRIQEVKRLADAELVDLSGLYKHQPVESNIEDVGIAEQETKGVDKNLEKLRQLRQSRLKQ